MKPDDHMTTLWHPDVTPTGIKKPERSGRSRKVTFWIALSLTVICLFFLTERINVLAFVAGLLGASTWGQLVRSSYIAAAEAGVIPSWLASLERMRAYSANEEFDEVRPTDALRR